MNSREELARSARAAILSITERVPVSVALPEEGALTLVDDGNRRMQAMMRDGKWVRPNGTALSIVPTHWLKFQHNDRKA